MIAFTSRSSSAIVPQRLVSVKIDLIWRQKRPNIVSKKTCLSMQWSKSSNIVSNETFSGCQLSKARVWARELRPNRAGSEGCAVALAGRGKTNPAAGCEALGRLARPWSVCCKDLQLFYKGRTPLMKESRAHKTPHKTPLGQIFSVK